MIVDVFFKSDVMSFVSFVALGSNRCRSLV